MPKTRRDYVFFILGGFFLTNAILAELTGGKLFTLELGGGFAGLDDWQIGWELSIGVLMWPVVFITTDLINEYYGKEGVRKLTLLAVGLVLYCFGFLYLTLLFESSDNSPVSTGAFQEVFGQSMWIIIGSVIAFMIAQLIDVIIFRICRHYTGGKLLWLRATGSTVVSQLIDSYVVVTIAFILPGKMFWSDGLWVATSNYTFKLLVAIGVTPMIYLGHSLIERFLGQDGDPASAEPAVGHPEPAAITVTE